jgi:serine/threonine protein kinase
MSDLDAATAADTLQKIGLVNQPQLDEIFDELGGKHGAALSLLNGLERKGYLTPWQTSKFLKGDRDGFFLGGYRVLYKVQSGSFGRVFRAQDESSGRVVAVKILRRRWSEDQQKIELFQREARVGMSLHHPNIVEVLAMNVERTTGQYYIVMEFVEGSNLRERLAIHKKIGPLEAIRLIEDCTAGLSHAYSRGVTHRDMKLTNILVSSSGTAKLVDFGLAKLCNTLGGNKEEEKVDRTVDYAGLEKATDIPPGDIRSDIYFLGCVLYEILCGHPPLEATRDKNKRMQRHRFDNVKPLTRKDVDAPPSMFRLLETMMDMNPTRRYQTPAQLLEAVKSVRRELEAKKEGKAERSGPRAVFVVESDTRLQDAIRDKLKELGYRVFLASDPVRALDRFRQQPFDGLIVDAGTTGEDGLLVFERIVAEADRQGLSCGSILILSEVQAEWKHRLKHRPGSAVMVRPVTLKQLHTKVKELVPIAPAAS